MLRGPAPSKGRYIGHRFRKATSPASQVASRPLGRLSLLPGQPCSTFGPRATAVDVLPGDESDDDPSESNGQLLEVAKAQVMAAAKGRGNILPREAVRPEYTAGDDKMFHIIDGQWGIVLVKDVMPAKRPAVKAARADPVGDIKSTLPDESETMFHIVDGQWGIVLVKDVMAMRSNAPAPAPVPRNSKTTRARRAVPVDDKKLALTEEPETMFHIIDGQWGTVLVKDVMPAKKMPARNETPAPAEKKATVPYNRSPCGRMQMIEGQYASIQPETAEIKFE